MGSQIGRPTEDPKDLLLKARLSKRDMEKMDHIAEVLGMKKSEVIRKWINEVYEEMTK